MWALQHILTIMLIEFFFLIKISFRVSFADFFPIFLMQSKIIFYYFKCPCRDLKFDPSIRNGSISVHSQSCKISYFDCVIAEFTRHTDVYSHELDYWIPQVISKIFTCQLWKSKCVFRSFLEPLGSEDLSDKLLGITCESWFCKGSSTYFTSHVSGSFSLLASSLYRD